MLKVQNRLEVEKQTLAALLQYQSIFADIDGIVKENFYSNKLHQIIFGTIRNALIQGQPLDKFTISNNINNLNISFEVDVYGYLEALEIIQLNQDAAINYFKELAKIWAKEQFYKQTELIQKYLSKDSQNDSLDKVISVCDSIYSETTKNFSLEAEPQDLFEGTKEYIEDLGLNETISIPFPFPRFQKYYGDIENGTLTLFVAGYKVGKSWFLTNLLKRICTENENTKGLYIDTEMKIAEAKRRLVSELTNINEYYLRHGWRKNKEMVEKVRAVWPIIEKWFGKIQHLYVGNISSEETESLIRRWVWKNKSQNPNIKPVVVYDYFKLHDGDSIKDAFASSMVLGYKVDRIKKLAQSLDISIIAAAQTNAEGNVGLSREIPKFVDNAFKLRKRTIEEIESEGGLATHKIETICNRSLGPELKEFNDQVKIGKDKEGKTIYRDNAILYKFANFRVEELNTLQEHIQMQVMPRRPSQSEDIL
jgi:replicative DNA helicase